MPSPSRLKRSIPARAPEKNDNGTLEIVYSTGWRVWCTALAVAIATAMTNMEVTIIGTSLVSIVEELQGFDRQGWVVTAYLITYTSLIVIWSKVSAIFGRKSAIIAAMLIFTAFSGGCGAAQTIDQLIIMRAFQGIGAAGCMSCAIATIYDLVPKSKYPSFNAMITAFSAIGALVGPVIGGAFSQAGQWRWAFLINVPIGGVVLGLFAIATPSHLPYQNNPLYKRPTWREQLSRRNLSRLDLSGTVLLLAGSMLLVTAILEGGSTWAWNSGTSIALFVVSGILFILFMVNERIMSSASRSQEPLFPWHFLFNRAWLGVLLTSVLSSIPYNTVAINLPQRFQIVEGDSPLRAGERMIPFNFFIAIGAIGSNIIAMKTKISPIFLLFFGCILESIGVGLLAHLPFLGPSPGTVYLYQILGGMGTGFVFGLVLTIPPSIVDERDKDIAGGAIFQTRVFGGAFGLSIASTVLNNYVSSHLDSADALVDPLLADPTTTLARLSSEERERVLKIFAQGYSIDAIITAGLAAAQVFSIALMWKRPQIALRGIVEEETSTEDSYPANLDRKSDVVEAGPQSKSKEEQCKRAMAAQH